MGAGKHYEIERKYLIRYPDIDALQAHAGVERWEIAQTYLTVSGPSETRRVRRIASGGAVRYFKTFKRRLTGMTSEEDEGEIGRAEYEALLEERHPDCATIEKTRYRIPHGGHTLEVDVYPFWKDRAILEIELEGEDEHAAIPDYLRVVRDVSDDFAYKNRSLAERVVFEEI